MIRLLDIVMAYQSLDHKEYAKTLLHEMLLKEKEVLFKGEGLSFDQFIDKVTFHGDVDYIYVHLYDHKNKTLHEQRLESALKDHMRSEFSEFDTYAEDGIVVKKGYSSLELKKMRDKAATNYEIGRYKPAMDYEKMKEEASSTRFDIPLDKWHTLLKNLPVPIYTKIEKDILPNHEYVVCDGNSIFTSEDKVFSKYLSHKEALDSLGIKNTWVVVASDLDEETKLSFAINEKVGLSIFKSKYVGILNGQVCTFGVDLPSGITRLYPVSVKQAYRDFEMPDRWHTVIDARYGVKNKTLHWFNINRHLHNKFEHKQKVRFSTSKSVYLHYDKYSDSPYKISSDSSEIHTYSMEIKSDLTEKIIDKNKIYWCASTDEINQEVLDWFNFMRNEHNPNSYKGCLKIDLIKKFKYFGLKVYDEWNYIFSYNNEKSFFGPTGNLVDFNSIREKFKLTPNRWRIDAEGIDWQIANFLARRIVSDHDMKESAEWLISKWTEIIRNDDGKLYYTDSKYKSSEYETITQGQIAAEYGILPNKWHIRSSIGERLLNKNGLKISSLNPSKPWQEFSSDFHIGGLNKKPLSVELSEEQLDKILWFIF